MPLFEYRCTSCGASFEQLVRTTQNSPMIVCPVCKSSETQKLLSGSAVKHSSGGTASASAADCAPVALEASPAAADRESAQLIDPASKAILKSAWEPAFLIFREGVTNQLVYPTTPDPFPEDGLTKTPLFMLTCV